MTKPIILLDLNYTLVSNSPRRFPYLRRGNSFPKWVSEEERYRGWLVDLLRDYYVIMLTARPVQYMDVTLAAIDRACEWQPNEAYFQDEKVPPPVLKSGFLDRFVIPAHGEILHGRYLALECNGQTRAMYARRQVAAMEVPDDGRTWLEIPAGPKAEIKYGPTLTVDPRDVWRPGAASHAMTKSDPQGQLF